MKRDKWRDFEMSGKIEDYLCYKGLGFKTMIMRVEL